MPDTLDRGHDWARVALAGIRLFNGVAALLAPRFLIRRLGLDPAANAAMVYPFRMCGIRTLVIGAELLLPAGEVRAHAQRTAIVIHTSDALAALWARLNGDLPPREGTIAVVISTTNVLLSLLTRPRT
jgi:hypothetical protein